jgi:hypothetical protein
LAVKSLEINSIIVAFFLQLSPIDAFRLLFML